MTSLPTSSPFSAIAYQRQPAGAAAPALPSTSLVKGLVATLQNDTIVVEPLRAPAVPRFPTPQPMALRAPCDDDIAAAMFHAREARLQNLHNLLHGGPLSRGPRPSVKDGSARIDYMFTRCVDDGGELVRDLACVGAHEGFRVVVETDGLDQYGVPADVRRFIDEVPLPACFRSGEGPRGHLLGRQIPAVCGSWAEDDGEVSALGVNIPAATLDGAGSNTAVLLDRERRGDEFEEMYSVGEVAREFRQYFKLRLALSMDPPLPVRESLSHVEGGNMLPYKRPDGSLGMLVGADSFAATIETIARDANMRFHEQEQKYETLAPYAKAAIAADFDLNSPNDVTVGAQGAYHLDVHAFCNGDTVVVDEPDEAADVELGWDELMARKPVNPGNRSISASERYGRAMDDWKAEYDDLQAYSATVYGRSARRSAKLEPFLKDLNDAGLNVARFGGRFHKAADKYNAISQENGTNPADERYVVLANTFVDSIRDHVLEYYLKRAPVPYQRVYLLDAEASRRSHREGGDISCRCKARTRPDVQLPSFRTFVSAVGLDEEPCS